jgi:hypothetical protein
MSTLKIETGGKDTGRVLLSNYINYLQDILDKHSDMPVGITFRECHYTDCSESCDAGSYSIREANLGMSKLYYVDHESGEKHPCYNYGHLPDISESSCYNDIEYGNMLILGGENVHDYKKENEILG